MKNYLSVDKLLGMSSQNIRRQFLQYFKNKGHTIVPSSPVIPHDDPTLLFVNAGMNQFKDVFLGKAKREYTRASSCQKCIRVGGKHNDLENVGHTTRHLTFFEMLGNFSFGDYFKKEAIDFGFEVSVNIFNLDVNKIYATVLHNDDEAFELWTNYLPSERIIRMGEKDNFWAMGDTGPCGPCSELLYDRGEAFGKARNPSEDISGERFFEFWNHVFMQYNRKIDGSMEPLPKQSVDTGAGLERIALLQMGVRSLFETDVLREIISETENLFKKTYNPNNAEQAAPFHVIADHLRSLSFSIADGVQPSNIDRGYVLRKVLRRAVRYGRMLGIDKPFLGKLLPRLVSTMGSDYPELVSAQERINDILTTEEENFLKTLQRGGNILNQIMISSKEHGKQISGQDAFKLKDTYGLPLEEILLLAKDNQLSVDISHFEELEKEAKERSRTVRKSTAQGPVEAFYTKTLERFGPTTFVGFEELTCEATVLSIIKQDKEVEALHEGEEGALLLDTTAFYSEKGGQMGDSGQINGSQGTFFVHDTKSPVAESIYHYGITQNGSIRVNDRVRVTVDSEKRKNIAGNHTATHLLHWALHEILGSHIKQAGSVVDADRLRFDFNHHKPLTSTEISQIENLVNQKIRENTSVRIYEIPHAEALKRGEIKQFFGDKYGSVVRVVDIDYSKELCGGTHAKTTGMIGFFKITNETSIAAGVRRIEAATGQVAASFARQYEEKWSQVGLLLKAQEAQVLDKVKALILENEAQLAEIKKLKKEIHSSQSASLLNRIETHKDIPYLGCEVSLAAKELKEFSDLLLEKQKSLGLFLVTPEGALHVRLSKDLVQKGLRSDVWLKEVASSLGGKGGGNADLAQGSVPVDKVDQVLSSARAWMQKN